MANLQIIKKEASFNTILFVALEPDKEDINGDLISELEITKTAHEFMLNIQEKVVDIDHKAEDKVDDEDAKFVESYIAPVDILLENGETIPAWSWIIWMKFTQVIFDAFVNGDFVWISIEWEWYRIDV